MAKPEKQEFPKDADEIWEFYRFCSILLGQVQYMDAAGSLFKDTSDPKDMPLTAMGAALMNHLMEKIMRRSPKYAENTRISREEYNVMTKVATQFLALIKN
ncbi:hypothetical protein A2532_03805 [Candidatus Wolfebacteria bacterium RIFOXYD2_FULL_48_11]|nr:MAG: hypothetical protein A2532_03805 [Candidatus Wolfebacteria bacterium RIFOXYD2_FULL_48_11]